MNWLLRKLNFLGEWQPGIDLDEKRPRQTERVLRVLFGCGGAMILIILLFGLLRMVGLGLTSGTVFIFWSLAAAFLAFLVGGATGLLFGLPTVQRIDVQRAAALPATDGSATQTQAQGSTNSTGYVEGTSLEKIADFLVSGLIALTLTTFTHWVARFDTLAGNLTTTMMGSPLKCVIQAGRATREIVCPLTDRVPGGLILAAFALLGFLTAYLWMRRYFIAEMVTARKTEIGIWAEKAADERQALKIATASGLTGTGTSLPIINPAIQAEQTQKIAEEAVATVEDSLKEQAREISNDVLQPNKDARDPWKGVFGGSSDVNGCRLTAIVSPMITDPDNFQVDLTVTISAERRTELAGKSVHYYLHPTFGPKTKDVPIDANGIAALQLFSYGGFTVGVLIDDGTKLELDLSLLPGVPDKFRAH